MRPSRVVIALEEPDLCLQIRAALEALGGSVVGEVGDAESGWHMARRLQPDAVFLDASTPSLEAAEAIRSATEAVVLFVSAVYDRALLDQTRKAGGVGFLVQPVSEAALSVALALALDRRAERQALQCELTELKEKLEARKLINRAKAILMERHGLTEPEAFRRLQVQSMSTATPMKALAEAVILSSQVMAASEKPRRPAA
jgi:two-component system, response regulator PdtaR